MESERIIYLATGNADKVRDFETVFDLLGMELRRVLEVVAVKEDEGTLLENARVKALVHSVKLPDKVVMAIDGGVKIPFGGRFDEKDSEKNTLERFEKN